MLRRFSLLLPLVLMGCVEGVPMEDACGANALQDLVGRDAAVLQTMRFGQTVRFIRPGMAVTMDYAPERLNITIDATETIVSVTCG
jgi:Peptidase inhibitor I78 family